MTVTTARVVLAGAMAAALLAACAPVATPSGPVDWDDALDLGKPGSEVAVRDSVTYYPACGNEVLVRGDTAWFPFTPANTRDFPAPPADAASADATAGALPDAHGARWGRGFGRTGGVGSVAAPGPGDDTGTLTEYEGGFAYWVSDNGELDTWLTTTTIRYSWVC